MLLHIHTFKWGDLYTADDVNRLRAMFARHLSIPHVFHCSTDAPAGLRTDILIHALPSISFCDWEIGNGRKLAVFGSDFLQLEGALVVQTDIDLVLVGNVDFLADRPEEDFLIARGRNQAHDTRGHAAVLRHRIGTMAHVWERLVADPARAVATAQHHRSPPGHISEQRWLDGAVVDMRFFDDGRIVYFRQDCGAHAGHDHPEGIAVVPQDARIVSFAGKIKPQHVMHGSCGHWRHAPFVAEHWHE